MKPGRVRILLRLAHRWASLTLGLPIALVAAAGAAVNYWFEVDALAAPAFYQAQSAGPPLPADRIADAARRALPGARIENIFLNQDGRVAIASLSGPWGERLRDIAVDRASGDVLGERWQDEALIDRLYAFHTRLLLGEAGRPVSLALAVIFVGLLASGVVLWWPSPVRWRAALSWRVDARRPMLDLHAKIGAYGIVMTAAAGVTAILLSWPAFRSGEAATVGKAPSRSATQPMQALVDAAVAANEGWRPVNLLDIDEVGSPLRVILWRPAGLVRSESISFVTVDRENGMVATEQSDALAPVRALHNGRAGGEFGRAVMAAGGLIPLLLWITGLAHWLRASASRRSACREPC